MHDLITVQLTIHIQSFHLVKASASLPYQQDLDPCRHKVVAERNSHKHQNLTHMKGEGPDN